MMPPQTGAATGAQQSTPVFQSLRTRGWIVACFYLTVAASLPFWLKTTSIERLRLPRERVAAWEARLPCPIRFQHRLHVNVPSHAQLRLEDYEDVADEIARKLRAAGDGFLPPRAVEANLSDADNVLGSVNPIKTKGNARPHSLANAACIDWDVHIGTLDNAARDNRTYVVDFDGQAALKSDRHHSAIRSISLPWRASIDAGKAVEVAQSISAQVAETFELPYRDLLAHSAADRAQEYTASRQDQAQVDQAQTDKRRVPYTKRVRLVFSLVNEDMAASGQSTGAVGVEGWGASEIRSVFARRIDPLLANLKGTHIFTTEMQAIWFAPLQFQPKMLQLPAKDQSDLEQVPTDDSSEVDIPAQGEDASRIEAQEDAALDALSQGRELQSPAKTKDVHLIGWNDLQIFVHAGEWGLATGGAAPAVDAAMLNGTEDSTLEGLHAEHERTLHFVLYVPQPKHRPLRIAGDADAMTVSPATGWLIPQWGGVSLYNLGHEGTSSSVARSLDGRATIGSLTADELVPAFATFEKQLRSLLGVKQVDGLKAEQSNTIAPATRDVLALDALVRRRALETSRESVQTLASIVRLVDKIKVLSVDQQVRDDVAASLELLEKADAWTAPALLDAAADMEHARDRDGITSNDDQRLAPLASLTALLDLTYASMLLSSRAFFNPRMLGQLYFPDEHKYAVYTPLFGPLAVPLLVAGLRLLKERRKTKAQASQSLVELANIAKEKGNSTVS